MATEMGMLTGMTSWPIPSPGIKPIRSDLEAIGAFVELIICLIFEGQSFRCQDTSISVCRKCPNTWQEKNLRAPLKLAVDIE